MDESHPGRPAVGDGADASADPDSEPPTAVATPAQLHAWSVADTLRAVDPPPAEGSEPPTALASPAELMALAARDAREAHRAAAAVEGAAQPKPAQPAFDGVSTVALPEGYALPDLGAGAASPPPAVPPPVVPPPVAPPPALHGPAGLGNVVPPAAPAPSAWAAQSEQAGPLAAVVGRRRPTAPKPRVGLWVIAFVVLFLVTLAAAFFVARWWLATG